MVVRRTTVAIALGLFVTTIAQAQDYPILDDPDCVEGPIGTFTCERGNHGDVYIDPPTANFDEFQQLIADCRAAWQAEDPTIAEVLKANGYKPGIYEFGGEEEDAREGTTRSTCTFVIPENT